MAIYYCAFAEDAEDTRIEPDWWEANIPWIPARKEENEEWFRTHDAAQAAEKFAKYAQDNMDMWEADDEWTDEYAIHVRCPDGQTRVFNIRREYEPTFSATRVESES